MSSSPKEPHDSPYAEHSRPKPRGTSSRRPRGGARRKPASAAHSAHKASAAHAVHHKPAAKHVHHAAVAAKPSRSGSRRRRGKGKGGGAKSAGVRSELTSHPTTRNAYVETRAWLLREHGPVCAYCGSKFSARVMTLDHVAPRRGQTAYDRRDNLVLSCPGCNQLKKDLAPLAFLLGLRSRAVNLVRYGAHLSAGLLEMARSLIPIEQRPLSSGSENIDRMRWDLPTEPGEDSPYRD
jgi:5-methylcytosine-specific restriction endonuclease McrA